MYFICHLIDVSCEFIGGIPLCYVITLKNLVTISTEIMEIHF